jgi:hypothetical protein
MAVKFILFLDNALGHPHSLASPIRICNLNIFLNLTTEIQELKLAIPSAVDRLKVGRRTLLVLENIGWKP